MKKYTLLSLFILSIMSVSYCQKTVKTYDPAYVINTKTLERIALESQLNQQSFEVQVFIMDYPILDDLTTYSKHQKYSMINTKLIKLVIDGKKIQTFYLTNGKKYRVKKSKRINRQIS